MSNLSVAVMAHPARAGNVDGLQSSLGMHVPVSWDDEGPPSRDRDRRWRTGRAAWLMAADDADWHVVLQDDAVVCPRFVDHLSDAASHVTDNGPVVPYLGTKRPLQSAYQVACRDADRHGAAWIRGLDLSWGVAIALRTELIPEMIAACDGMIQRPYDLRISRWMRRKAQLMCWYTWPSLVDHDDGGESLIAPDDDGRHARRMWDGRTMLRWDGPVVDDPRIPRGSVVRRGLRGGRRGAP